MSFVELVEAVAERTGLPKTVVSKALKGFTESAKEVLESGESVKLTGFGVFETRHQKERPLFGGTRMSGSRSIVRFRQSRGGWRG